MLSDEAQIRELVRRWHEASRAGDIDTVLGLMTDDVVFLVVGHEPFGKAEFAEMSRTPPGAPRPSIASRSRIEDIHVSGDVAYLWSELAVSITPPGAQDTIERAGHTLTVFRRIDGKWLLARDANLLVVLPRPGAEPTQ